MINRTISGSLTLSSVDSAFTGYLRSLSILVIVFGHVGGFWFFRPYSEFLHVFVAIFFFLSGAVNYYSYNRTKKIFVYYAKKLISLLVPYYLLCLLSLFVFIVANNRIPHFDLHHLIMWLQIRPSPDIHPFPIGQVWFIHTLFFITLLSPVWFYLNEKKPRLLVLIIIGLFIFSSFKFIYPVNDYFFFFGNNIYLPLIHSMFYVSGIILFSSEKSPSKISLITVLSSMVFISIMLILYLDINPDYEYHIEAPDMYYCAGCFAAISLFLLIKKEIVEFIDQNAGIIRLAGFLNKHAFSFYLMHTFAIFLVEISFFSHFNFKKNVAYGILKLCMVFATTTLLVIPFTKCSHAVTHAVSSVFGLNSKS